MKTLLNKKTFIIAMVLVLSIAFAGFAEEALYVDANGNVGIGTTEPGAKLDVRGSIEIRVDDADNKLRFHDPYSAWYSMGIDKSDGCKFKINAGGNVGDVNHFTMTNSGNIGIGTTNPKAKFSVSFSNEDMLNIYCPGVNRLAIQTTLDGQPLGTYGGNNNRLLLQPLAGFVGIGIITPNHPLHMGSGAHCTAGGTWVDASSIKYKENIIDLKTMDAINALNQLKAVKFNYKKEKGEEYLGFIAEDVPELVATSDRKGLAPMDIVAVLTKVVQEQQNSINELQSELASLTGKDIQQKSLWDKIVGIFN